LKRRSYLSLSALSAVPVAARAADEEPYADGWGTIDNDALEFTAVTDERKITLQVERFIPPKEEVTQAMDEKGEHRCYQYKGKDMPGRFCPGQSLLTRFDLTWDGKRIPIAERFWNDMIRARPSRPRTFGARQPPAASYPKRLQAFAVFHQLARHRAATTGHFFLSVFLPWKLNTRN
jgi:hypothetical protein